MPKIITLGQIWAKKKIEFGTVLKTAMTNGFAIPGLIVAKPSDYEGELLAAILDQMVEYAISKYTNCIYYLPVEGSIDDMTFTECYAVLIIQALSVNQKYRNLCNTLANIELNNTVDDMTPSEWYLHNYKVAYTGTEAVEGSGSASARTGLKTEKKRQIATLERGTSGETTATLRDVSLVAPSSLPGVVNPTDSDETKGSLDNNNTSSETESSSSSTTTYDTLKQGYYNTGNKTTILKDVQDLAEKAPFFQKWLDEIMQSIIIPVYTSTFGCKTERF